MNGMIWPHLSQIYPVIEVLFFPIPKKLAIVPFICADSIMKFVLLQIRH